jgi:indole-3-glycerol phosphate synthase
MTICSIPTNELMVTRMRTKKHQRYDVLVIVALHLSIQFIYGFRNRSFLTTTLSPVHAYAARPFCGSKLPSPTGFWTNEKQRRKSKNILLTFRTRVGAAQEDIYAAVHRKEYEMKQVKAQHVSTTDPVRMAMGYAQESPPTQMRLAAALRRVHDDPSNPANIQNLNPNMDTTTSTSDGTKTSDDKRTAQMNELGLVEMSLRRGSFIADIKRKSLSRPGETLCRFDDAGMVAQAMVRLGADAVFINTDYTAYGGDMSELKSAVKMVRQVSKTAAVVMKDIVVDEIQLGLAKEAGADGIVLMSSVLGPALESFLNLATIIGLETIVECHTKAEVERALLILAPNILVNNHDRIGQTFYPQQAIQLAGLFPGSGGPIICLATGNIDTPDGMKRHLAVGYDGIVIGKAIMGSAMAPELIRACRDRTLLPAELSQWGLLSDDDTIGTAEFDMNGDIMSGPKRDIPSPNDPNTYQ